MRKGKERGEDAEVYLICWGGPLLLASDVPRWEAEQKRKAEAGVPQHPTIHEEGDMSEAESAAEISWGCRFGWHAWGRWGTPFVKWCEMYQARECVRCGKVKWKSRA